MPFGKTLRRIRREKGMTQRDVADALKMDYAYYSRLENDRFDYTPIRGTVEKLAAALDCSEAERVELLHEAGRIDQEIEQAARMTHARPDLRELFRAAPGFSPEVVQKMLEVARRESKKPK